MLALARNGVARAYPVCILNWYEIVNDRLEGEVTYCPLCGTGMVFDARVGSAQALSFGVSGLLYNSDMLMYDRNSECQRGRTLSMTMLRPSWRQ